MRYENASDVLPAELLREVQKHAAGKLLYIPVGDDRKAWGEASGYREQLLKRNRMIRNKYAHGVTLSELADEYFLSLDTIKKIIYAKKTSDPLTYFPTVASAVQYANQGLLEEWVHCYLTLTRQADADRQSLLREGTHFFGVVKFPLRLIPYQAGEETSVEEPLPDESPCSSNMKRGSSPVSSSQPCMLRSGKTK